MAIRHRTVKRTIAQWKKDGEVHSCSGNSGRAKILIILGLGNRRKSVQQLTKMFSKSRKKMSPRIMHCELKEMGSRSCAVTRKPLVSKANQKKMFKFAKYHKDWTVEQWKRVLWLDESRFILFQKIHVSFTPSF